MDRFTLEAPVARELSLATHLRAAVLAQRIYPTGSPIVERAVSQIMNAAESALKTVPRLTLTDRQGRLYANGREEPDASALAGVLQEHGVQSLSFTPGITGAEVTALVRLLSRRRGDGRKLADLMAEENLSHIQADKVTVVEIEDGETVTRKMNSLFDQVNDFPHLVGSLREAYDMIDRVPGETKRREAEKQMANRLAAMPAHLLRDLFENPLPKRVEDAGLRDQVLKEMTKDKIHDIFSEIGLWYQNIRKNASSDFEAVERLNQLKSFMGKLLGSPASRHVPFAIYEELLRTGLISSIPEDVRSSSREESLPAQVDRLLAGSAAALLESPSREKLPGLMSKLCAVELFDLAQTLAAKFLDNFYQESAVVRRLAAQAAPALLESLWRSRRGSLGDHLYAAFRRLADDERSREVYAEIAEALTGVAARAVVEGRAHRALDAIELLRRHAEADFPFMPSRGDLARRALESAAGRARDVLVEEMLSSDNARSTAARSLLEAFGDAAAPALVEAVKKAVDLRTRRAAAMALKGLGEAGVQALSRALNAGLTTPVLLTMLSVAEDFLSPGLLPSIRDLLLFPDGFVRTHLARFLGRLGTPPALDMLESYLDDPDEVAQLEAVRALGEARHRPAAAKLGRILPSGSVLRREEVCIALGKIADDACVAPLAEALWHRGLFPRRGGGVEESVRVRAAWALSNIRTPLARAELAKLANDGNAQVRMIVRQAMEAGV